MWLGQVDCPSQKGEPFGEGDGRAAIIHAELAIDIGGMHLDGSRRDYQFARKLLVGEVLVQQTQDVRFALGLRFQALLPQQLFP
jgi:hypothetical protein